jgi:hypothetical protein
MTWTVAKRTTTTMPDDKQMVSLTLVDLAARALQGILSNPELCSGELNVDYVAIDAANLARKTLDHLQSGDK